MGIGYLCIRFIGINIFKQRNLEKSERFNRLKTLGQINVLHIRIVERHFTDSLNA